MAKRGTPKPENVPLGKRLRAAREARVGRGPYPRSRLARELEVDVMTIYRWERGWFRPSEDKIKQIETLLGVDPGWLVAGDLTAAGAA